MCEELLGLHTLSGDSVEILSLRARSRRVANQCAPLLPLHYSTGCGRTMEFA